MRPRRTASSTTSWRRSREIVTLFSSASRKAWTLCSARELSSARRSLLSPCDAVAIARTIPQQRTFQSRGCGRRGGSADPVAGSITSRASGGSAAGCSITSRPRTSRWLRRSGRGARREAVASLELVEDGARLRPDVEVAAEDQRARAGEGGRAIGGVQQLALRRGRLGADVQVRHAEAGVRAGSGP